MTRSDSRAGPFALAALVALVALVALAGASCARYPGLAAGPPPLRAWATAADRAGTFDKLSVRVLSASKGAGIAPAGAWAAASLLGSADDADEEALDVDGEEVLDGEEDGGAEGDAAEIQFPPGFGVRWGFVMYPWTLSFDLDSRFLGATLYLHFNEKETRRMEGAVSFLGDTVDMMENNGISVGVDYVKYVGEEGFKYWFAGGGATHAVVYDDTYTLGYLRGGAGYWLGSGENGLDLRAGLETMIGNPVNAALALFFSVGYDL